MNETLIPKKESYNNYPTRYLHCDIGNGLFKSERWVCVEDYYLVKHNAFVDDLAVIYDGKIEKGKLMKGYVAVSVYDEREDKALINLPGEGDKTVIHVKSINLKKLEDVILIS